MSRADRGVRIDATADPMRVDFLDGTDAIKPGLFKFDGEQLVLALPGWVKERALGKGEDYPTRPTAAAGRCTTRTDSRHGPGFRVQPIASRLPARYATTPLAAVSAVGGLRDRLHGRAT
jgi:hypothetical protein